MPTHKIISQLVPYFYYLLYGSEGFCSSVKGYNFDRIVFRLEFNLQPMEITNPMSLISQLFF